MKSTETGAKIIFFKSEKCKLLYESVTSTTTTTAAATTTKHAATSIHHLHPLPCPPMARRGEVGKADL